MINQPKILGGDAYLKLMLEAKRPQSHKVLAFYEHRVGAICKDIRFLLAPLDDHLCHRGDGVFESVAYREGKIFQLDAHLERMQNSAKGLKLRPPCTWEEIREYILAVATAGECKDGAIRILLGRGAGGFGISPAECPETSLYIVAIESHIPHADWYNKGLTACRSSIPAKQAYLATLKNANYLPNVLMAEEAIARGVDITFSFTEAGYLAESAVANVALISEDNRLICPPLTNILCGTTLTAALEVAKDTLSISFEEIVEDDIFKAKEVLLFGSSPLCVGVTQYEGQVIANGQTGKFSHILREKILDKLLKEGIAF